MLTVQKIRSSHAKHYYQAESIDEAEWFGKGAANLSLRGTVSPKSFNKTLDRQLIPPPQTGHRRPAYDLCFGSDKSISLLGLVAQRQDVIDAHKQAVKESLKKIEDDFIQVRATVDGNRKIFYSHNLIAAQFHHATSRADDPHLHTHVVLFNASKFANKWRAVLEKKIYDNVAKIGKFFRNNLAMRLQGLGFDVEQSPDGWIKVKGYTKEQISAFSQRRNAIQELVGENASFQASHAIGLKIRPKKSNIPLNDLIPQWQQKADNLGVVHPIPGLELNPIDPDHLEELVKGSGIDADLARLNFETISGDQVTERLLHERIPEGGEAAQMWTGKVKKALRWLETTGVTSRGWWAKGGYDAQNLKEKVLFGSYKADAEFQRLDRKKNKPIKYEHPLDSPRRLFLLEVPKHLAEQIFKAHGVTQQPGENFWETVKREKLPITITEGAKKTASLLSNGIIAVGVSGVNGTYRLIEGKRLLNEDVKVFADGRVITFAYDQDSKLETKAKVSLALVRGAALIEQEGSPVTVKQWYWKQGKGVDDLIVAQGFSAYEDAPEKFLSQVSDRVFARRFRKLMSAVKPDATPGNELMGVAYLAINQGGLREAIKVLNQSPEIKHLDQAGKKEAIQAILKELHYRFTLQDLQQASVEPQSEDEDEL